MPAPVTENAVEFTRAANATAKVTFQKKEAVPVCVALLIDRTASRERTIGQFKRSFAESMLKLQEQVGALDSVESIKVIIGTYTGDFVHVDEKAIDLQDIPVRLADIKCYGGVTNITGALEELDRWKDIYPKIHGIIVIGDTTDGDSKKALRKAGFKFGRNIPIVTLLDKTPGSVGTKPEHLESMKALSEASGVSGCPVLFENAQYEFSNTIMAHALAAAGPDVLAEARDKGIVQPDPVRDPVLNKIANPTPVALRKGFPLWGRIAALAGAVGITTLLYFQSQDNTQPAPPPAPETEAVKAAQRKAPQFPNGSSVLTPESKVVLQEWAEELSNNSDCEEGRAILVVGHASLPGTEGRNKRISENRASTVADFLRAGGLKRAVKVVAKGEEGATPTTEDYDRRVELVCER